MSDTTYQTDKEEYPMARPATQITQPATYASVSTPSSTVANTSTSETDINNPNIEYVPPINYSIPTGFNEGEIEITPKIVSAYQYAGAVKCLTMFDIFIGLIYALSNPYGIFVLCFPLIGYYGAARYDIRMTQVYLAFQVVVCLVTGITINTIMQNDDNNENEKNVGYYIINLLFNLYFILLTWKYIVSLGDLTAPELTSLKVINFMRNSLGAYRYW